MKGRKGTQLPPSLFPILTRSLCFPSGEVSIILTVVTGSCADIRLISHALDCVPVVCACVYIFIVCVF